MSDPEDATAGRVAEPASTATRLRDRVLLTADGRVVAVGFASLSILAAYIVRVAAVSQRTAAITPSTSPQQELRR